MAKKNEPADVWELFEEMNDLLTYITDRSEAYRNARSKKFSHDAYLDMIFESKSFRHVLDDVRYISSFMKDELNGSQR